jgi:hypothetical protein
MNDCIHRIMLSPNAFQFIADGIRSLLMAIQHSHPTTRGTSEPALEAQARIPLAERVACLRTEHADSPSFKPPPRVRTTGVDDHDNDREDPVPVSNEWWDYEQIEPDTSVYRSAWLLRVPFPAESHSAGDHRIGVHLEYESDIHLIPQISVSMWNELAITLTPAEAVELAAALLRGSAVIDTEFDSGISHILENGGAA